MFWLTNVHISASNCRRENYIWDWNKLTMSIECIYWLKILNTFHPLHKNSSPLNMLYTKVDWPWEVKPQGQYLLAPRAVPWVPWLQNPIMVTEGCLFGFKTFPWVWGGGGGPKSKTERNIKKITSKYYKKDYIKIMFPGCPSFRPSVFPSIRHVLGVPLCMQRPAKAMPFQQIIMHALQCQHDLDVHLLFCVDLDLHITSSRGRV